MNAVEVITQTLKSEFRGAFEHMGIYGPTRDRLARDHAAAVIEALGLVEERQVHVSWSNKPVPVRVDADGGDVLKDERRWVTAWAAVGDGEPRECICPDDAVHSWCPIHGQPDDGYPGQVGDGEPQEDR